MEKGVGPVGEMGLLAGSEDVDDLLPVDGDEVVYFKLGS